MTPDYYFAAQKQTNHPDDCWFCFAVTITPLDAKTLAEIFFTNHITCWGSFQSGELIFPQPRKATA